MFFYFYFYCSAKKYPSMKDPSKYVTYFSEILEESMKSKTNIFHSYNHQVQLLFLFNCLTAQLLFLFNFILVSLHNYYFCLISFSSVQLLFLFNFILVSLHNYYFCLISFSSFCLISFLSHCNI